MKCPLCDYDARDADDLFGHFASGGWRHHGTSSTAKAVAKAVGIKSYESGFADVAGTFDAGGLEVVVPSPETWLKDG